MTVIHALLTVLQLIQIIIMQTPVHTITIITDFIDNMLVQLPLCKITKMQVRESETGLRIESGETIYRVFF